MDKRLKGYDMARSFSIIFVFFAHIILAQSESRIGGVFLTAFSPGITMSLLGFISATLLANSKLLESNYSLFLLKRLTRLFIPVFLCLTVAALISLFQGLNIQKDHLVFNYLGLGLFFDWFKVPNNSTVGWGLWFVTAIFIMYIFMPIFKLLFQHKNKIIHFILFFLISIL